MREINIDELKKIEYDMLVDFAKFCDKNNLIYFLSSGTLLGAVRHHDFIPWDDDIDVMLPRKDYEKFVTSYKNKDYFVDDLLINNSCWGRCGKLKCRNTILESNLKENYKEKVFIDIFPIDGICDNKLIQKIKLSIIQLFINFHMSTITKCKPTKRYADKNAGILNWKTGVRTLLKYFLILTIGNTRPQFWTRIINGWLKKTDFNSARYAGFFAGGYYGTKELMPKKIFDKRIPMKFGKYDFWIPEEYDYYLTNLYGNYMKFPPIEKRQPHHAFKAYWLD